MLLVHNNFLSLSEPHLFLQQSVNNTKDDSEPYLLPLGFAPGITDVMIGKGKCKDHVGNERLRRIVASKLNEYKTATTKNKKSRILSSIVNQIRYGIPSGGFYKQDPCTKRWFEVGDSHAKEKISQAFRNALHTAYRSSVVNKKKRRQERQGKIRSNVTRASLYQTVQPLHLQATKPSLYQTVQQLPYQGFENFSDDQSSDDSYSDQSLSDSQSINYDQSLSDSQSTIHDQSLSDSQSTIHDQSLSDSQSNIFNLTISDSRSISSEDIPLVVDDMKAADDMLNIFASCLPTNIFDCKNPLEPTPIMEASGWQNHSFEQ